MVDSTRASFCKLAAKRPALLIMHTRGSPGNALEDSPDRGWSGLLLVLLSMLKKRHGPLMQQPCQVAPVTVVLWLA